MRPVTPAKSRSATTDMSRPAAWAATALLCGALAGPGIALAADGGPTPPVQSGGAGIQSGQGAPPASAPKTSKSKKKEAKKEKRSDREFLNGYKHAHALIYEGQDYEAGIAALRALGRDDHADVANLLGFASRKLGRYDDAKYWYEKALATDPNHSLTWSYYGMWQAEQGNLLKARDYLDKVRDLCGTTCRAYVELQAVIDGTGTY